MYVDYRPINFANFINITMNFLILQFCQKSHVFRNECSIILRKSYYVVCVFFYFFGTMLCVFLNDKNVSVKRAHNFWRCSTSYTIECWQGDKRKKKIYTI